MNRKSFYSILESLNNIGFNQSEEILPLLEHGLESDEKLNAFTKIFSLSVPFLALIFFVNKALFFLLLPILIMTNYYILESVKKKMYGEMSTFTYLSRVVTSARSIANSDNRAFFGEIEELKDLNAEIDSLYKNMRTIRVSQSTGEFDLLIIMINILFLMESRSFFKTVKLLNDKRVSLLKIYELVGKIDAFIALASQVESENLCKVDFTEGYKGLAFEELINPLVSRQLYSKFTGFYRRT